MNIIRQSISFIFIIALSLLISGCGGPGTGLSLVGDDNNSGNEFPQPPDLFPPHKPPPVPVITAINAFTDRVELDWSDTSIYEDGFIVERDGAEIARTSRNISAWTDTNVQPGATYCYAVRSYNAAGKSAASPQECAITPLFLSEWAFPVGFGKCDTIRDGTVFEGKLYLIWAAWHSLCISPEKAYLSVFSSDKTDAVELSRTELILTVPISIAIGGRVIYIGGNIGITGALTALNADDLTVRWELSLDELGGDFSIYPAGIRDAVIDQDSIFVTGDIMGDQSLDVITIRFDLDGNYIWSERWGTSCLDWGEYLTFADDGIDVHAKAGQLCEILSPDTPAPAYQGDIVLHYAK